MRGNDFSQLVQGAVGIQSMSKRGHGRLATGELFRDEVKKNRQCGMYVVGTAACPADRTRQGDVVGAHVVGCHFQALGLLDLSDHLFEIGETPGESGGKAIGQQAEGALTLWAVPTGNMGARRIGPFISTVARQRTPAVRMQRATFQGCIPPGLSSNVFLAGELCFESQLHWPTARTVAAVAGHSLFGSPILCPSLATVRTGKNKDKKDLPMVGELLRDTIFAVLRAAA